MLQRPAAIYSNQSMVMQNQETKKNRNRPVGGTYTTEQPKIVSMVESRAKTPAQEDSNVSF